MKYDNLISCSRCGSDACYTQEVNKDVSLEFCYGCGFQTNSLLTSGSDFFNAQMEILPDIYKALMDEEESGKLWMPTFIKTDKGMVFADGSGRESWAWAGVKNVEVKEEEKEKYKNAKYRADMETIKHWPEGDIMEALDYIGHFNKE